MSTRVNGPRIKQSPVFKPPQDPGLDAGDNRKDMGIATSASSCASSATSASTSRLKNSNEKGAEPVNSITLNNKGKDIASSSRHGSSNKVVRVIYHSPVAYWPIAFFFFNFKLLKKIFF